MFIRFPRRQQTEKTIIGNHQNPDPAFRIDTVELLDERKLLPAIYFIFSRAQCDEAAKSCVDAGLSLTTPVEGLRQVFGFLEQPNLAPRYNIAPSQEIAALRLGEGRGAVLLVLAEAGIDWDRLAEMKQSGAIM